MQNCLPLNLDKVIKQLRYWMKKLANHSSIKRIDWFPTLEAGNQELFKTKIADMANLHLPHSDFRPSLEVNALRDNLDICKRIR